MEFNEALQVRAANLSKQPAEHEKQLERLFDNPHFGDVVTEVFPEVLNPHSRDGMAVLKKYADVALFLDRTNETDDAIFIALRFETENLEHDKLKPRQGLKAASVRYYKGVRAEDFDVERDEGGRPSGVRINHASFTSARGWQDEPRIRNTEETAVVDVTLGALHWRRQPLTEQESYAQYIFGDSINTINGKVRQLEDNYRLMSMPLWSTVLDIQSEIAYRKAGRAPQDFLPIE
jgi:hypothetical protein